MYFIEYFIKHLLGQSPRLGVVSAAMIGIHQPPVILQRVDGAVSERPILWFKTEAQQYRLMGNPAERQDHLAWDFFGQFLGKEAVAGPDFLRCGLVSGWQALHRVGNPAADQA